MHLDPAMPTLVASIFGLLLLGYLARLLRQPTVIAYLVGGILLGPAVLGVVHDAAVLGRLGATGVLLLLFFVGLELSLDQLLDSWRVIVLGTIAQIALSVLLTMGLGWMLGWPPARGLILGFVISLSSTAVIIRLLQEFRETQTRAGSATIGILIAQDLAVVPMIVILGWLAPVSAHAPPLGLQSIGALACLLFVVAVVRAKRIRIPFQKVLLQNQDLQVFGALLLFFGMSSLTAVLGLSSAIGAFLAGLFVSRTEATHGFRDSLEPFRVVFLAAFFVSIGMLLDLHFVLENAGTLALLVVLAYGVNTGINTVCLRFLDVPWRESLYMAGLLSQVGEFSFVLAAIGLQAGILTAYGHQMTICVISLSILFSPLWVSLTRRLARPSSS
ncbi:MAG: cation:proton antiporter [Planctomycetes bacterium]|nr:cation:proton antiporter [Planctomycetota bacterium]